MCFILYFSIRLIDFVDKTYFKTILISFQMVSRHCVTPSVASPSKSEDESGPEKVGVKKLQFQDQVKIA